MTASHDTLLSVTLSVHQCSSGVKQTLAVQVSGLTSAERISSHCALPPQCPSGHNELSTMIKTVLVAVDHILQCM